MLVNFNPDMVKTFNHRITLKQYTVNELVDMACTPRFYPPKVDVPDGYLYGEGFPRDTAALASDWWRLFAARPRCSMNEPYILRSICPVIKFLSIINSDFFMSPSIAKSRCGWFSVRSNI